jgi:hypothetical protein
MENNDSYNSRPLTEEELENALHECKGTSPGLDDIHYEFLKRMDTKERWNFQKIWSEGEFPKKWRRATVIPILKPRKNPTNTETTDLSISQAAYARS